MDTKAASDEEAVMAAKRREAARYSQHPPRVWTMSEVLNARNTKLQARARRKAARRQKRGG